MSEYGNGDEVATNATGYEVLFVGLVCFYREGKWRRALLPDGRQPVPSVTPHFAYIGVDADAIIDRQGWYPGDETQDDLMTTGLFRLPKCSIYMTGVDKRDGLDSTLHDAQLPSLRRVDPTADIDPDTADLVADMLLTSGRLEAFKAPGTREDDDDFAVISRLEVDEPGPITVIVEPVDGSRRRTLTLKPGTSVAIANIAFPDEGTGTEHFSIFGRLVTSRILNGSAQNPPAGLSVLPASHPLFAIGVSIMDGTAACGNHGCC
jgi:hypothetical protein